MDAVILVIVIIGAVRYMARHGHFDWQAARAANRRGTRGQRVSRRAASAIQHDAGYWIHQVLHGFPQARYGVGAGWHAGRTAQAEGAAARQQARTEHLSARKRLAAAVREQRRRQEELLAEIRRPAAREGSAGSSEGPACPDCGWPLIGPGPCDVCAIERDEQAAVPCEHPGVTCTYDYCPCPCLGCGGTSHLPADGATYSYGAPRAPAIAAGTQVSGTASPPTTEGTTAMAGDTTYTQQLSELEALRRDAEAEAASASRRRMTSRLDILQGMGLDSASLADAAEIDDALQALEKAAQRVLEVTDVAIAGLKRRHGGIQEAVDSSPVAAPANPEFYGG